MAVIKIQWIAHFSCWSLTTGPRDSISFGPTIAFPLCCCLKIFSWLETCRMLIKFFLWPGCRCLKVVPITVRQWALAIEKDFNKFSGHCERHVNLFMSIFWRHWWVLETEGIWDVHLSWCVIRQHNNVEGVRRGRWMKSHSIDEGNAKVWSILGSEVAVYCSPFWKLATHELTSQPYYTEQSFNFGYKSFHSKTSLWVTS